MFLQNSSAKAVTPTPSWLLWGKLLCSTTASLPGSSCSGSGPEMMKSVNHGLKPGVKIRSASCKLFSLIFGDSKRKLTNPDFFSHHDALALIGSCLRWEGEFQAEGWKVHRFNTVQLSSRRTKLWRWNAVLPGRTRGAERVDRVQNQKQRLVKVHMTDE